jgi:beta-glucosidase
MKNGLRLLIMVLVGVSSTTKAASEKFLFGVSNAAFQVEGHPVDSDWYRWTHSPGRIADGTNADIATDFWNRYEEDFRLSQT